MTGVLLALTLAAAAGSGLLAGLFFAFSVAVMRALGERPPAEGMAAMQAINAAILNPLFAAVFFGTPALCAAGAAWGLLHWSSPGSDWLVAGSLIHLAGGFGVTFLANVPLNQRLAAAGPTAADVWADYLRRWTAWNHVRTVACLAAMILLMVGAVRGAS